MDIHKLLKRQCEKTQISIESRPDTNEKWLDFIDRINKTYLEMDKERYFNERSMEIFSREMKELNEKLENAQHIAHLGYWYYDIESRYALWSKEVFTLFNLQHLNKPHTFPEFMELVYESDRDELLEKVQITLKDFVNFECEIRVAHPDGKYYWYKMIGQHMGKGSLLSGIFIDIHKDKEAEDQIKDLNNRLLQTARSAGMSEVAISILHNVGNILNSANVSISLLKDNYNKPYYLKLFKIIELMNQHSEDMSNFISNDPKGKIIPRYLSELSQILLDENKQNVVEIDRITKQLEHIKEIVSMQNLVSGISSMYEKVSISELIDEAVNISSMQPSFSEIKIEKNYEKIPTIDSDKSKVLQILINLIQNGMESILENTNSMVREIKIFVKTVNNEKIEISVIDSGMGIDPVNVKRMFSFGFTTKKNGHGFGLHSSALSAQEMGGSLIAKSDGIGCGAEFILTLPIRNNPNSKGVFNE